jgi:Rac GTPase-activating protein 1
MPVSNLAKVFGPTLVGHSSPNIEPMDMLREVKLLPTVVEKLLAMPADYWNQFLHVNENIRSPPYNPNTHRTDGTPLTPECRPGL